MMLPRLAIATATTPTGQTPAASGALASGRTPAAEVIANLRAEVLLRLVETMLKQLQRGQSQNGPANALLEILLDALKTMPAGSSERGEGLRDIAAILARVPPEARPAVERLLHKTIASLPTRILVEILRNPESPAAQKLASMIALLSAADADAPDVHSDRPRAIVALEAKLAESHTERRPFPRRENGLIGRGDARALQAELRRLFEPGAATRGSSGLIPADPDLPIAEAKTVRAAAALERAATAFPEKQAEHSDAAIRPASTEAKVDAAPRDAVTKADTSPNRGAAPGARAGVRDSFIGLPKAWTSVPSTRTGTNMPRAFRCGSCTTSAMVLMGVTGIASPAMASSSAFVRSAHQRCTIGCTRRA